MLTLHAATSAHLDGFRPDPRHAATLPQWRDALAARIAAGDALAVIGRDRLLAFGGFLPIWPGRAMAWCLLAADIPMAAWVPATRLARQALAAASMARIEADIRADFPPAARWARLLGFGCEGPMEAYWEGATFLRFARIA